MLNEVQECAYCRKDVWGKYLVMKKGSAWHTFCVKRQQKAAPGKSMNRASYLGR